MKGIRGGKHKRDSNADGNKVSFDQWLPLHGIVFSSFSPHFSVLAAISQLEMASSVILLLYILNSLTVDGDLPWPRLFDMTDLALIPCKEVVVCQSTSC